LNKIDKEEILRFENQKKITINKEMLKDIKVLNQVFKKFIICTHKNIVIVVDQHAASERIRLEEFEKNTITKNFSPGNLVQKFDTNIILKLEKQKIQLLKKYQKILKEWYWNFDILHESNITEYESLIKEKNIQTVIINSIPVIFDVYLKEDSMFNFIFYINEFGNIKIPDFIQEILNSKACRGAIMFNDYLSKYQCEELLKKLGECNSPFFCAHGRPCLYPLIDTSSINIF
jgi:DNA mismatch repair protein MLH3